MNPRRYLRLLKLDLHLLRRHGALTSITVFTTLICLLVWLGFRTVVNELPPEVFALGVDPLTAMGGEMPGAELSWLGMASVALSVRTLPFCLPLILVVLTGRVVANSIKNHTLREDLARPISREWLLAIRFSAISLFSLLSLVICVLFGLLMAPTLGLAEVHAQMNYTNSTEVVDLLQGVGLIWLRDMTVIAIAMLLSLLVQPAGRMMLLLILGFVGEAMLRGALFTYAAWVGERGEWAAELAAWLPGEALDSWKQWPLESWELNPILALLALLVGCLVLCGLRFRRMDII